MSYMCKHGSARTCDYLFNRLLTAVPARAHFCFIFATKMSDAEDDFREDLVHSIIDSEQLIVAVENKPALYNKQLKEYSDRNIKEKLWSEVCAIVIPDWHKLSSKEKQEKGKNVQKKWKNLKDRFSRELAKQKTRVSGDAAKKRRKYVYFDSLLFLLPSMQDRPTSSNVTPGHSESGNADINNTQQQTQSPAPAKRSKKRQTETTSYEKSLLNILESKSTEQLDEDKNFALMLVPMLKKLNDEQKHFAKVEILNVMKCAKDYHPVPAMQQTNMSFRPQFPSTSIGHNIQNQWPPTLQRSNFQCSGQLQQESYARPGPHVADAMNTYLTQFSPQVPAPSPSPSGCSSAASPDGSSVCSELYDMSNW